MNAMTRSLYEAATHKPLAAAFLLLLLSISIMVPIVDSTTFGLLVPQTGDLASIGPSLVAAANQTLANQCTPSDQATVLTKDTGTNPQQAVAAAQSLYNQGVRTFFGPQTSAELQAVLQWSAQNAPDAQFCSAGSTTTALNQFPNVVRMTMNDDTQGRLLATQFQALGFTQVLVLARNDTYGQGLVQSLT